MISHSCINNRALAARILFGLSLLLAGSIVSAQSTRVAFFGDTGANANARSVIDLARRESVDLIVVLGDLAYQQKTPAEWIAQYDDIIGADFPLAVVLGNHEENYWPEYQAILTERLNRTPELICEGNYGVKSVCRFRGITIVGTAPGINSTNGVDGNDDYAGYIRRVLAEDDAEFSVCAWHKNMRDMQLGGKSDDTGWGVYEACREGGALIATGHEHSYSRTHLMSSFEFLSVASTDSVLELTKGKSFAVVSGLGGVGIRNQDRDGAWWAAKYTSDQSATYGAMFCDFGIAGDPKKASCYFKNVDDQIVDSFELVSRVNDDTGGSGTMISRIGQGIDDVEEATISGSMKVASSDLELTHEGSTSQIVGLRFNNLTIPQGSVIKSATVQFVADEASTATTNLRFRAQAADDAPVFTATPFDVSGRDATTAEVHWENISPWDIGQVHRSPDLSTVIQEVISRPGWQSGASMAVIVDGTGSRVADSYEGSRDGAPLISIDYEADTGGDDPAFSIADLVVDESAGTIQIPVEAAPTPTVPTRIWVATTPDSAINGQDFYGASKHLEFLPGERRQTISIRIIDDTVLEGDESFTARIFDPDIGTVARRRATISINDDDLDAKALAVDDVSVNEDAGSVDVTVTLSPPSDNPVSVHIATSPDSAINGQDFYGLHRRLEFQPGETTKTVAIQIVDDAEKEAATEKLNVNLFNAAGANLRKRSAVVTIIDDD